MDITKIEIYTMSLSDLEEIKENLKKDFDEFWNFQIFKEELAHTNSSYLVMRYENIIIGFAGFKKVLEEADLMNIVIAKEKRGQGFSRFLLQSLLDLAFEQNCTSITLEVNRNNLIAIQLYTSFGFKQIGLRKKYYNGKEDAILMKKLLP